MDKHTPGPWYFSEISETTQPQISSELTGRTLAICYENGGEERANAFLIAAAPDLLEALRECHQVIGDRVREHRKHGAEFNACSKAWSAITKATG